MQNRNVELIVVAGAKLLGAVGVAYVLYAGIATLFPHDSWPPKDDRAEELAVARYKLKLLQGDSPLSPRTPADTAVYLSRIIDHEVKKGDLVSGRVYITQAIGLKLDGPVESLVVRPDTKTWIAKVRDGVAKRDRLAQVVACYEKRPGDTANQDAKNQFAQELQKLSEQFCEAPFDPSACPELAAEMAKTYQVKLAGIGQDPRLRKVVEEIEHTCLPRPPAGDAAPSGG